MKADAVLFEEISTAGQQRIGVATLNAEKSLNSLTQDMIDLLSPKLAAWKADDEIALVFLKGAGEKAFCAGGDIINLHTAMTTQPPGPDNAAEHFFCTEYRLNYTMHTYPKPIVCWGHGIVMGGGLGLMAGSSHRIATEKSRIAMPEIGIGLYPDVGGTWFLPRMPGGSGLFLGLTGASMNAGDALYTGTADYFIESQCLPAVLAQLQEAQWSADVTDNHETLSRILRTLHRECRAAAPPSKIEEHIELINDVTDHAAVEHCLTAIEAIDSDDKWLQKSIGTLKTACPVSALICFEQYQRGLHLSLKEAFMLEWVMAVQVSRHNNFSEGIRALLIDKDLAPKWEPGTLAETPKALIDAHLTAPEGYEEHPLSDL